MKLPINKKMIMIPGVGIVVFVISVLGMIFMKGSKNPTASQTEQEVAQETGQKDSTEKTNSDIDKKNKNEDYYYKPRETNKLPSLYKKRAVDFFKPLSSSELARMIKELKEEKLKYERKKELLDFKEKTLESVQADLDAEREEMTELREELNKVFKQVTASIEELKKETIELDEIEYRNVKRLASVYSGMKPQRAALILKEMDEESAVKLLSQMDEKTSAEILEKVTPQLAVKFSEKLKLLKNNVKKRQ